MHKFVIDVNLPNGVPPFDNDACKRLTKSLGNNFQTRVNGKRNKQFIPFNYKLY